MLPEFYTGAPASGRPIGEPRVPVLTVTSPGNRALRGSALDTALECLQLDSAADRYSAGWNGRRIVRFGSMTRALPRMARMA